jgi:hypothetical protein
MEQRRREELAAVPYFAGLMASVAGESDALVRSFAGEPELHHPVRGRIKGDRAFETFVSQTNEWLAGRNASVEEVDFVRTEDHSVEEAILRLDGAPPAQPPSGGAPSNAGMASSMLTQGWALAHQMFIWGSSQDGSSSVPAISQSHSGVTATSAKTGEPHLGQNLRVTGCPLPPKCSKPTRSGPSICRLPFGRTTRTENAELVCFWQSRQWQTAVSTGSASPS